MKFQIEKEMITGFDTQIHYKDLLLWFKQLDSLLATWKRVEHKRKSAICVVDGVTKRSKSGIAVMVLENYLSLCTYAITDKICIIICDNLFI